MGRRRRSRQSILILSTLLVGCGDSPRPRLEAIDRLPLPAPALDGPTSVESALSTRRSVRSYSTEPPSLAQIAQLLWAAQGITDAEGHRTAPSAHASYPVEVHLAVHRADGLPPGHYRYDAPHHQLELLRPNDVTPSIVAAAGQDWIHAAPAILAIVAVGDEARVQHGALGERHVHIEAGHIAQNVYLQATTLRLGTVLVGGFNDEALARALALPASSTPLALMPFGRVD